MKTAATTIPRLSGGVVGRTKAASIPVGRDDGVNRRTVGSRFISSSPLFGKRLRQRRDSRYPQCEVRQLLGTLKECCCGFGHALPDRRRQSELPLRRDQHARTRRHRRGRPRCEQRRRCCATTGTCARTSPSSMSIWAMRVDSTSSNSSVRAVCRNHPAVILISAHAEQDLAELIADSPAVGFLSKMGLSPRAIVELVDGHRNGDRPVSAPPER